jgi:hypothetical protein
LGSVTTFDVCRSWRTSCPTTSAWCWPVRWRWAWTVQSSPRASGGRRRSAARWRSAHERALVAEYDQGERCRGLRGDLNAYVARVASDEQANRVRRHLSNCQACAHTARELELVARGMASILPLPATLDAEAVHRFGALGRTLGRLLPFWDGGEVAAATKAGAAGAAAAAGGTSAATVGGSLLGGGATKFGVAALCVAGASGGYVVCDQVGLFGGPLPRERPAVVTSDMHRRDRPGRLRGAHPRPHALRPRSFTPSDSRPPRPRDRAAPRARVARVVCRAGQQRVQLRGWLGIGGLVVFDAFVVCLGARGKRRNDVLARKVTRVWLVQHTVVHTADVEVRAGLRVRLAAECSRVAMWPRPAGRRPRLRSSGHPVAGGRRRGRVRLSTGSCACVHRDPSPSGVAKRPRRPSVSAAEGLDEVRGLAIADQSRDVGDGEWLVRQEFGGVAQSHRA